MSIWLSCSYCSISFQFLCWCFQFPSFMPCALLSIAWNLNQQKCKILYRWLDESVNCTGSRPAGSLGTSTLYLYVTVACHWLSPCLVSLSRVQSLLYLIKVQRLRVFYVTATRHLGLLNRGFTANSAKRMAAAPEKVFVALPAEFKVGRSSLSWVLSHFGGCGATIVITHVHVPPQMIPVSTCFLILYMLLVRLSLKELANTYSIILATRIQGHRPPCWSWCIMGQVSCSLHCSLLLFQ